MSLLRSYKVLTLGCKLNQFDSASIEGQLRARGFSCAAGSEHAGVVVINTCTVTGSADREARRLARRARRENPGCRLIVTGCYAELDRGRLEEMKEVDAVIGQSDRDRLPALLDGLAADAAPESVSEPACIEAGGGTPALHFGERSRAFLKVQEGCDLRCSYCIIPKVRGASRSVEPALLAEALAELIGRGYREIVLTGVNTGDYGKDLSPRSDLESLLRRLLEVQGLGRLRLNSLEPRTASPGIALLMRDDPRLARHLQVPLQSGSDPILKMMYRNYRAADYLGILESLRREVPEVGLGADVIVGFPSETDDDFDRTCRLVEASQLNYLHVFPYSDRPGTAASTMSGRVAPGSIRERSARLRAIGAARALAFRRSFVGATLPVLVLRERRPDGRWRALSDNFIDMGIEAQERDVNRIVGAVLVHTDEDDTLARLASPTGPAPPEARSAGLGREAPSR